MDVMPETRRTTSPGWCVARVLARILGRLGREGRERKRGKLTCIPIQLGGDMM